MSVGPAVGLNHKVGLHLLSISGFRFRAVVRGVRGHNIGRGICIAFPRTWVFKLLGIWAARAYKGYVVTSEVQPSRKTLA
jgi:hypothetical protein